MKTLIMIAALITSTIASANVQIPGVLEFNVINAKFNPSHVTRPDYATLTLDYNKDTVRLFIAQHNNCPINAMCIMSMPAPVIVELPIISVHTDSCGVKTVVAKKDSRPVDGALEVLTVKDVSMNACDVLFLPVASYRTEYFNRMSGGNVVIKSTMGLQQSMLE